MQFMYLWVINRMSCIENIKDQLIKLCETYDIKTMYVFGSAVSEQFSEDSDMSIEETKKLLYAA